MTEWMEIHARVAVTPDTIQTVVEHAKKIAKQKGGKADPADTLSVMISKFLSEKDFAAYVSDGANYP